MQNGDEILANKIRRKLFNHIVSYPGVSLHSLKELHELSDSNLRYHIHYLEKNDKIISEINNGVNYYYPHPSSLRIPQKSQQLLESYKLTREQEKILTIIMQNPSINQKGITVLSKLNRFKVSRCINSLKQLGLVKNKQVGNMVCYEYIPDTEMKYKILRGLIVRLIKNEIDEETFLRIKKRLEF
jgi:predicted transcriptional regulator